MRAGADLKNVHPLGKSPVITVTVPGTKPRVIAESALIVEYLTEFFGKELIPTQFNEGHEGQIGQETEAWERYRFWMHYAEVRSGSRTRISHTYSFVHARGV